MKRKILNANFRKAERLVIFNRAPAATKDGWIHIVPKGNLPNAAAGIVQVLDDTALDSILANIEKDKNRKGDNWEGIYGGREHFIYDGDKDSAALAWFKEFQKRSDGIWAKEDGLTPGGSASVQNREYKFTSFVADPADLQKTRGMTDDLPHYRVMKIETVGFTNFANGKELLTPIANRSTDKIKNAMKKLPADKKCPDCDTKLKKNADGDHECPDCGKTFSGSGETDEDTTKTKNRNRMKKIATALDLTEEASEDAILSAVTKLKNRITQLEPLDAENTKLKNRVTELDGVAVDALLASHGVKEEKVLNRLRPVIAALPVADRAPALIDFGFKPGESKTAARVLNRGGGADAVAASAATTDDDQALTEKIKNRANELKTPHRTFDSCWQQARREILPKK